MVMCMETEQGFDTLLMTGILKALKEKGLLTEDELQECIAKVESEEDRC